MKYCPMCGAAHSNHKTHCDRDRAMLVESRELQPGTVLRDKYEIVRALGRGAMGVVYLARHILLDRLIALKFLSGDVSDDPKLQRRFLQEAKLGLRHTNIVEVFDLEQAEDGSLFIVMEYVVGLELREVIADGLMPVGRALTIIRGVLLGLSTAHARGIIHRDIKPENIMLAAIPGEDDTPKILDFGIAAMKQGSSMTRTRGLMLTPEYAAPEQWKGMSPEELDGRVDFYAVGGVLYEMLTGQLAFHAHAVDGLMYQHLMGERIPPSKVRPELAEWQGLDEFVLRLLAVDRDQRPGSIEEVFAALDAIHRRTVVTPTLPLKTQQGISVKKQTVIEAAIKEQIVSVPFKFQGKFPFVGRDPDLGIAVLLISLLLVVLSSSSAKEAAERNTLAALFFIVPLALLALLVIWLRWAMPFARTRVHFLAPCRKKDATAVFRALKAGNFTSTEKPDIFLTQEYGQTVLSFVAQPGHENDPRAVRYFANFARSVAPLIGGFPLRVQLLDAQRMVRHIVEIEQ